MTARMAAGLAMAGLLASGAWAAAPVQIDLGKAQARVAARMTEPDRKAGGLPRLSHPTDGPMLRAALDYRALTGNDPFEDGGLEVCEAGLALVQAYYTEGVPLEGEELINQSPDQQRRTGANAASYHDELALGFSFIIDCFGRFMQPVGDLWTSLDAPTQAQAREGVLSVRNGGAGLFRSTVNLLGEGHYSPDNKADVLAALLRNAPAYAAAATPAQRAEIRAAVASNLPRMPAALHADAKRLSVVFELTGCTGLCAV